MSDTALGPQWWLAADGKWHPPELRPPSALHLVAPIIADTDATVARETELPYETEASVPSDTDDAVAFEAAPDAEETVGGEPASLIDTEPEPVEPIVAAVEEVATDDVVAIDEDEFDDTEFSLGDIAVIDGTPDAPAMEEQAPVEPVVDPVRSASSTPISPVLPGSTSESTSRDPGLPPEIQRAMSASIARDAEATPVPPPPIDHDYSANGLNGHVAEHPGLTLVPEERPEAEGSLVESESAVAPTSTDEQPVPALDEPEPEPVVAVEPEPVVAEPAPEPVVAEPAPEPVVAVEPEPVMEPEPVVAVVVEPEPVVAPVPAAAVEPEPIVAAVEPTPIIEPAAVAEPAAEAPVAPAAAVDENAAVAAQAEPEEAVAEVRPISRVTTPEAPRTTNIPASIAAKNADLFKGSREFPDLLNMAMKGSSLADQVEVHYDATSLRKSTSSTAAPKNPPPANSERGGKRWKRKGR